MHVQVHMEARFVNDLRDRAARRLNRVRARKKWLLLRENAQSEVHLPSHLRVFAERPRPPPKDVKQLAVAVPYAIEERV